MRRAVQAAEALQPGRDMTGREYEQCMKSNSFLLPPLIIKSVENIKQPDSVLGSEQKKGEKQQGRRRVVGKARGRTGW